MLFKYTVISSTFLSAPAEATEIDISFRNDVSITDPLFEQKYSEGSPFDFPKRIKITAVNSRASEVAKADEVNEMFLKEKNHYTLYISRYIHSDSN